MLSSINRTAIMNKRSSVYDRAHFNDPCSAESGKILFLSVPPKNTVSFLCFSRSIVHFLTKKYRTFTI